MAVSNPWLKLFYSASMHNLVKYLLSSNCESQVLAIDANAENIQTTGGKQAIINGIPVTLAADAEYDISAEAAYVAWSASGVSYTLNSEVVDAQDGAHWVCIQAHTSSATNGPLTAAGPTYWKKLDKWAVDAKGNSIAQDKQAHYLVCALSDGTLRAFIAYDTANPGATSDVVIPAYDPERYVAVGLLSVVPTSGAHILGTTALTSVGTFKQLVGPVFPSPDKLDLN